MNDIINNIFEQELQIAKNYVIMDVALVTAMQDMSLNASKLIRFAITNAIQKKEYEFDTYYFSIKDLAKLFDIDDSNLYRDIQNICIELMQSIIKLEMETGNAKKPWKILHWTSVAENLGNGQIAIKLHEELKPYITNLKKLYTKYEFENIRKIRSVYGIRIFELLLVGLPEVKNFPKTGVEVVLTVDEIKKRCCCDKIVSYKNFGVFREKVINNALNAINKTSFYRIEYSYIKEGRKVVAFRFKVFLKND